MFPCERRIKRRRPETLGNWADAAYRVGTRRRHLFLFPWPLEILRPKFVEQHRQRWYSCRIVLVHESRVCRLGALFIVRASRILCNIFSTRTSTEGCYRNARAEKWSAIELQFCWLLDYDQFTRLLYWKLDHGCYRMCSRAAKSLRQRHCLTVGKCTHFRYKTTAVPRCHGRYRRPPSTVCCSLRSRAISCRQMPRLLISFWLRTSFWSLDNCRLSAILDSMPCVL